MRIPVEQSRACRLAKQSLNQLRSSALRLSPSKSLVRSLLLVSAPLLHSTGRPASRACLPGSRLHSPHNDPHGTIAMHDVSGLIRHLPQLWLL